MYPIDFSLDRDDSDMIMTRWNAVDAQRLRKIIF